jgi:hypothetical protein
MKEALPLKIKDSYTFAVILFFKTQNSNHQNRSIGQSMDRFAIRNGFEEVQKIGL